MTFNEFLTAVKYSEKNFVEQVKEVNTIQGLEELFKSYCGKKGSLSLLRKQIGLMTPDEKKQAGQVLNKAFEEIEALYKEKRETLEQNLEDELIDLTAYIAKLNQDPLKSLGHMHIITKTLYELEDLFIGMGFSIETGPELETDWYNFEALNIPKDHPARGMWDTLYVDLGQPESTLLRTHTSPVQIRVLSSQKPPVYMIAHGKCFRRDTPDASHLSSFHQLEGLVVDKNISFADLKGTIETFTQAYFGVETLVRLRPSYFPFTEPSAEFEISCRICFGKGCRTCSNTGWLELGGCGVVNENVLVNCNINPDEYQGFAFGFGIERLIQMKYQIPDLRILTESDMRFLANF
jgi:phenylalanyl-tRNA synthetase alpha chain